MSLQVGDVAPRVHLDLYPDGDPDDLVNRLLSIGARSVQRHEWWHVLESPGGLPFCVVQEASGSPAPPTAWPDGHRSRVVQVCVDIPAARWDVELRFWPAALGWATTRGSREEFADLVAPPQSPLRVLLQRLRTDDTGSVVRAHLDLGADDVGAEVRRLVRLGARVGEQPDDAGGWVVLTDPLGSTFCVTARHP